MFLCCAKLEREYVKERQAEGIAITKNEEKYNGRKPIQYPKDWDKYY